MGNRTETGVIVVGTGFSGLGMAIQLRKDGRDDFVVLEKAEDVGGTWRDNSYPGCACDIPSHMYSFSFEQNPGWSRAYSPQPEIYEYMRGVSASTDLLRADVACASPANGADASNDRSMGEGVARLWGDHASAG